MITDRLRVSCLAVLITAASVGPSRAIEPNRAGDLAVEVFVSPSDDFIKEWVTTSATHAPVIRRIREARVGQLVYVGFALTGHTATPEGEVRITIDVRVLYPDGKTLFEKREFASYSGKPKGPGFVLGDPVLEFMAEHSDPLGVYTIEATATDASTAKRAAGRTALEIKP